MIYIYRKTESNSLEVERILSFTFVLNRYFDDVKVHGLKFNGRKTSFQGNLKIFHKKHREKAKKHLKKANLNVDRWSH